MAGMPAQRDPVSKSFDAAAARLLRRAYRAEGRWVGTRLGNPSPEWVRWGRANGVNLLGPDTASGGMARTRYARALVRSVYYLHKWHYREGTGLVLGDRRASPWGRPLQYDVSRYVRISPEGAVLGRVVRIRVRPAGEAAEQAVAGLPDSRRMYTDDGQPGGRFADPALRDW
jgi:hypothetical protein